MKMNSRLTRNKLQVDDNGKINRLRRECPAEECGAGVFMAAHHDRQVTHILLLREASPKLNGWFVHFFRDESPCSTRHFLEFGGV